MSDSPFTLPPPKPKGEMLATNVREMAVECVFRFVANCAAVVVGGVILGIVAQVYLSWQMNRVADAIEMNQSKQKKKAK